MNYFIADSYRVTKREENECEVCVITETFFTNLASLNTVDEHRALGLFVKKMEAYALERRKNDLTQEYQKNPEYFMRYQEVSFEEFLQSIKASVKIDFINNTHNGYKMIAMCVLESKDTEKEYGNKFEEFYLLSDEIKK